MKELKEPKKLIKITGIAGWVDIDTLSDKELMQWMKNEKTREKLGMYLMVQYHQRNF